MTMMSELDRQVNRLFYLTTIRVHPSVYARSRFILQWRPRGRFLPQICPRAERKPFLPPDADSYHASPYCFSPFLLT